MPLQAAQPVVDEGDGGPELSRARRGELTDLELDDDVAALLELAFGDRLGEAQVVDDVQVAGELLSEVGLRGGELNGEVGGGGALALVQAGRGGAAALWRRGGCSRTLRDHA